VHAVADTAIIEALRLIGQRAKLVVEPAGAAGLAGFRALAIDRPAVVILTGGNVEPEQLGRWLAVP